LETHANNHNNNKKIKLSGNKIQYRIEWFTIQILLQSKLKWLEQFAKL